MNFKEAVNSDGSKPDHLFSWNCPVCELSMVGGSRKGNFLEQKNHILQDLYCSNCVKGEEGEKVYLTRDQMCGDFTMKKDMSETEINATGTNNFLRALQMLQNQAVYQDSKYQREIELLTQDFSTLELEVFCRVELAFDKAYATRKPVTEEFETTKKVFEPRINRTSLKWWECSVKWSIHNLIAHPVSDILYWVAVFTFIDNISDNILKLSDLIHDLTVPVHKKGTGRG